MFFFCFYFFFFLVTKVKAVERLWTLSSWHAKMASDAVDFGVLSQIVQLLKVGFFPALQAPQIFYWLVNRVESRPCFFFERPCCRFSKSSKRA